MSENAEQTVVPFAAKPSFSHIAVTPQVAERWLHGNAVNRKLRTSKVEQYARDMSAGRWTFSNDALCFTSDNRLLNGQHRLNAIIRSGATIILPVMRNVPAEAMGAMDSGAARSAGDALGFDGEENKYALAAAAKLCLLYSDGRIYGDNKQQSVSHNEIRQFLADNSDIRDSVRATSNSDSRRKIEAPPSTVATSHWVISRVADRTYADFFVQQLASRTNEPDGSPILAVDSRLREIRRNRQSYPQRNYLYLFIKAWNLYIANKTVRSLAITPKGEFVIPKPARPQRRS